MAVAYAGGPHLTADQFRAESGVSCVPGVDTVSGGLRISDVKRVAAAHAVALDYGAPTQWPVTELGARLLAGEGAIVLGDAQDAPVAPTVGVVYHSAFVHDLDAAGNVHWHDPRLTVPYRVPLAKVVTYWESGASGQRYAGFVVPAVQPPQEEPMPGLKITSPAVFLGNVRTNGPCTPRFVATGLGVDVRGGDAYSAYLMGLESGGPVYVVLLGADNELGVFAASEVASEPFDTAPVDEAAIRKDQIARDQVTVGKHLLPGS